MIGKVSILVTVAALLCLDPCLALAHSGAGVVGGFVGGFKHPILGLDHLVAMVAVGLWGAFLGMPAIWLLPVVFPLVMAIGGAFGIAGAPLPSVETVIAISAIVLGLCVAFAFRPPLWIAACIVGVFAFFHGHAHGTELPSTANPLSFALGFVIATGLLHLCGVGLGLLTRYQIGNYVVRAGGAAIAAVGVAFLSGYA
ncbi:HupE/UreJ family protein [Rhodoblastus sp.]|jgi:urease accessory protein|uniref:HupE/UreJ family protein n=1 Tax=Rhodoblastus sp. TaxID=1962975 RepID=UPI0025DD13ED|nr:HupE/UreJ family protein [Rhodoblastus sp.]